MKLVSLIDYRMTLIWYITYIKSTEFIKCIFVIYQRYDHILDS